MAAHGPVAVAAIVVAAGSGERLGAGVPKAYVEVRGRTLLEQAVDRFVSHPGIDQVVAVVPASGPVANLGVTTVPGGATRQASVAAGLAALAPGVGTVLVHDAARPFVPAAVIDAVLAALSDGAAAVVPVLPIADTVRRRTPDGALAGVVDRGALVAVQTPQGFARDVLEAAHRQAAGPATDDAALVEALGVEVVAVPGADESFKITTPFDLVRAEALAQFQAGPPVHPSVPGGSP